MDKSSESPLKIVTLPPTIYSINLHDLTVDDLFNVYANQILIAASTSDVEKALIEYMNTYVEPVGWNAIWRATKTTSPLNHLDTESDFLVEVLDVSMNKLESTVKIVGVVDSPDLANVKNSPDFQCLHKINNGELVVPLIELYPLTDGDDEGFFLKTALAIEHIRFFYQNLWRPWDEEDDDDVVFAEKHLKPRLKLCFDIHKGIVPETIARKVSQILEQAWDLYEKLRDFNTSDSEAEYDEADVIQNIEYRSEFEDLQRQIEMLENPMLRTLVMSSNSSMVSRLSNGGTICNERTYPVLHLVGRNITLEKIKDITLDPNIVVRMYDSPETAVSLAQSGEQVLIYPDTYKCLSLGWIEENIIIKGMGGLDEIIIEGCKGGGDIFLNCSASDVVIENVTLKPDRSMKTTVLVHKGALRAKDCFISGGDYGLIVLEGAAVTLDSCNVLYSNIDGVNMRLGSSLTMKSSCIHHCEGTGLRIDGESDTSFGGSLNMDEANEKSTQVSTVSLENVRFYSNRNYGMVVEVKAEESENENASLDWNALKSISWLDLKIDDSMQNDNETFGCGNFTNGKGNIGKSRSVHTNRNRTGSVSSPPAYDKFLDSISRIKFLSVSNESDLNYGEKIQNWSTSACIGGDDDSVITPDDNKSLEGNI